MDSHRPIVLQIKKSGTVQHDDAVFHVSLLLFTGTAWHIPLDIGDFACATSGLERALLRFGSVTSLNSKLQTELYMDRDVAALQGRQTTTGETIGSRNRAAGTSIEQSAGLFCLLSDRLHHVTARRTFIGTRGPLPQMTTAGSPGHLPATLPHLSIMLVVPHFLAELVLCIWRGAEALWGAKLGLRTWSRARWKASK